MAMAAYRTAVQDTAKIGALRLLRDLNLDFATMFPKVIDTQIKGSKGDDLNALLKEYDDICNPLKADKEYKISWQPHNAQEYPFPNIKIDVTKFTVEERDKITEACRLIKRQRDETEKRALEINTSR